MTDYIVASGRVSAKMCSINMQYCYRAAAIQLGSLVSILAYSVYVIKVNKLNSSQNSCLSYTTTAMKEYLSIRYKWQMHRLNLKAY